MLNRSIRCVKPKCMWYHKPGTRAIIPVVMFVMCKKAKTRHQNPASSTKPVKPIESVLLVLVFGRHGILDRAICGEHAVTQRRAVISVLLPLLAIVVMMVVMMLMMVLAVTVAVVFAGVRALVVAVPAVSYTHLTLPTKRIV